MKVNKYTKEDLNEEYKYAICLFTRFRLRQIQYVIFIFKCLVCCVPVTKSYWRMSICLSLSQFDFRFSIFTEVVYFIIQYKELHDLNVKKKQTTNVMCLLRRREVSHNGQYDFVSKCFFFIVVEIPSQQFAAQFDQFVPDEVRDMSRCVAIVEEDLSLRKWGSSAWNQKFFPHIFDLWSLELGYKIGQKLPRISLKRRQTQL